jgi:hypothetical protein
MRPTLVAALPDAQRLYDALSTGPVGDRTPGRSVVVPHRLVVRESGPVIL